MKTKKKLTIIEIHSRDRFVKIWYFKADLPYDNPNLIVDLPNGMYTVKTFHVDQTTPMQTFVIGK